MEEMKITVLQKYLKETLYIHKKGKNISIELKYKIYQAYNEKKKKQSKNKFCDYLKEFGISRTSIKEIIQI
jgi:hypothetical protein